MGGNVVVFITLRVLDKVRDLWCVFGEISGLTQNHNCMYINGIDSNTSLTNKMIMYYGNIGDLRNAPKVFDRMPERNIVC